MTRLVFAAAIQRHVPSPEREVSAATVCAALEFAFNEQPELRGYILDDQGRLRRHVAVFVDGSAIRDRRRLSDRVGECSQIYVVQALSGG
jgi:sulfur carrier protein ThiS